MNLHLLALWILLFSGWGTSAQRLEVILPVRLPLSGGVSCYAYQNGIRSFVIPLQQGQAPTSFSCVLGESSTHSAGGFYELAIGSYRPMPFVVYGQQLIRCTPSLAELQGYTTASSDAENKALAAFLGVYYNYTSQLQSLQNELQIGSKSTMFRAVKELVRSHNEMNAHMDTLAQRYPGSYVARYLTSLYGTAFSITDSLETTRRQLHQHFFDGWNLAEPLALSNPFIMSEIDLYFSHFGSTQRKLYSGIGALLNRPDVKANPVVTASLIDMVSQWLFKSHHPMAEAYTLYMAETYGGSCGPSPSTWASPNSIPERLKRMQVGARFPPFRFALLDGQDSLSLAEVYPKQAYTLIYFWQSTCPHCTAIAPEVEKFTAESPNDMQTVAVSIDLEATKANLMSYLDDSKRAGRSRGTRWSECWEAGGGNGGQLDQIYLTGTPCFVLLNTKGEVLARSVSLDAIKEAKYAKGQTP